MIVGLPIKKHDEKTIESNKIHVKFKVKNLLVGEEKYLDSEFTFGVK